MKKLYFHPILFGLLPILSLYEKNTAVLVYQDISGTLLTVSLLSIVCWIVFKLITKNPEKSAFINTSFWGLFFGFRPALRSMAIVGYGLGWIPDWPFYWMYMPSVVSTWLVIVLSIFFLLIYTVLNTKRNFSIINNYLNWLSILLVGIIIFSVGKAEIATMQSSSTKIEENQESFVEDLLANQLKDIKASMGNYPAAFPDIYYIILDGYGRSDIVQNLYNYDNSDFLDDLRDRGFYIASKSRTNQSRTLHSLASSLNMMDLNTLAGKFTEVKSFQPLDDMIQNNVIFRFFNDIGYKTISFGTGYKATDIKNVDSYLAPEKTLSEFEGMAIDSTPLSLFLINKPYDDHRTRIIFALEKLSSIGEDLTPTFVFAHIISPHPPFVFDAEGSVIQPKRWYTNMDASDFMKYGTPDEYVEGYRGQVEFISREILAVVDEILKNSEKAPIIILQGDHGPGLQFNFDSLANCYFPERMSILNAYYFPDQNYSSLYDSVTPINTFRIILNQYFGTSLPLLIDKSYYATTDGPFQLIDLTPFLDEDPRIFPNP